METAFDKLAKVTGTEKSQWKAAWRDVKKNRKTLDECPGPHDFRRIEERFGSKYRCAHCGGVVDGSAYSWYMKGLSHGEEAQE